MLASAATTGLARSFMISLMFLSPIPEGLLHREHIPRDATK